MSLGLDIPIKLLSRNFAAAMVIDSITSTVHFVVFPIFIAVLLLFLPRVLSWFIATIIKASRCTSTIISRTKSKTLPPPKASHAWPIIGHLYTNLNHTKLGSMADEYGPIFTVQLGLTPAVVVSSSEVAKEIFTTHDLAVLGQPKYMAAEYFGYNFAMVGFTQYGPYWREMRKVTSVHLLSVAKLELFKHIRVFEVEEVIRELYRMWIKRKDDGSGLVLVEMKQRIQDMTFNIIGRMVSGNRYYGSSGNSDEALKCQEALREFMDKIGTFLLVDIFPFLRWFDFGGHVKSIKKKSKELDAIVQGWLDEHRHERKRVGNDHKDRDFTDVLLTIFDGIPQLGGHDSNTINKATCINMILGGSDTTTVTLTWALSLLLNNLHALKNAQDELDAQVGRDKQVTESDITNLPYLQAIVKETLRLYPAAPLSSPRKLTKDCVVAGYHVPKGTILIVNIYKIHRDPSVWLEDALKFRPERFLTGGTHKEVDIRVPASRQFELMPFGAGRRMCPGSNLGLTIVHLALASFLHAFELSTDAPVDMEEGFGLTVMRANPLNVRLAPRLPAHLYV